MKKFGLIILTLILVFTVVSCKKEETDTPDGMFLAENEVVEYSVYFPNGWTLDRNDGMISAHVSKDETSNVSVTTMIVPDEYEGLDEYCQKGITEHYASAFPDMKVIEEFTKTTLGDEDAMKMIFTATIGDVEYQFEQVVAIYGSREVIVLTYTSTPELFESYAPDVEKIINELRFN